MRLLSHHSQFTEILVEGNEDATFARSPRQDFIVPIGRQWDNCATRDAGIQKKFHEAVSRGNGSIRS